jgi:hypothetical protein
MREIKVGDLLRMARSWISFLVALAMLTCSPIFGQAPSYSYGSREASELIANDYAKKALRQLNENRQPAADPKDQRRLDDLRTKEKKARDELRALDPGFITQDQLLRGIQDSRRLPTPREREQENKREEAKQQTVQRLQANIKKLRRQIDAIPKAPAVTVNWLQPASLEVGQIGVADWQVRVVEILNQREMIVEVERIHTDEAVNPALPW